jgi:hypothetical protein
MPLTAFPEPADLQVDFVSRTGDSRPLTFQRWDVSNPHPGFGKDPNILNEYGHTKYPMWVTAKDGTRIIVKNAEEEAELAKPKEDAWGKPPELKQDGPTIQQYVAAGYKAKDYPPAGYASKSSPEEIKAAVDAEEAAEAAAANTGWGSK